MRINTNIVSAAPAWANVEVARENIVASQSRVEDADVAMTMAGFACELLRRRSGRAVVARAEATPRTILRLLG